jgi:glutamate N-acetyltransferase / amino-acid N-acetyltransferase
MTPGPGVARTLLPQGFSCSGVNSGVRRYRPDLGIITTVGPSVVAGVFTRNQCKAAPIKYSQSLLPSDDIRAIVTNSGQANAATGLRGDQNNLRMAQAVAQRLGCAVDQVLTASTGPIGVQMEIGKILDSIPELVERQGTTAEAFALAILTTDLVPKTVTTEVQLSKGAVQITGICKGSGMIHPNMGTMLGYFLTDAVLTMEQAQAMLTTTTDKSFNMISVDGDSSTNDCAFLMANGASQIGLATQKDRILFQKALDEVAIFLAKSIARDGEGATKLIEVNVSGSPDLELAKSAARGLVMSPLVKTAIHGGDPNWGRILARLGADQVPSGCLDNMSLWLQGVHVFENGAPLEIDSEFIRHQLRGDFVEIRVDFKSGSHKATAWGCDLSKKYVEINAEYLT